MNTKKFQAYSALSFPKCSHLLLPETMLWPDNNEAAVVSWGTLTVWIWSVFRVCFPSLMNSSEWGECCVHGAVLPYRPGACSSREFLSCTLWQNAPARGSFPCHHQCAWGREITRKTNCKCISGGKKKGEINALEY